jgi:O-acetyl-ADP-ribose deacetylase (regulator of RNase III)
MRIELHFGDITEYHADYIVNAARPSLKGGGGVDGAIHKKAGLQLLEYCKTLGGCRVGEAKLTPGFNLPAKFIVHTVGPRYLFEREDEEKLLELCYSNCLEISKNEKFDTVVFPNISTGAYGFPKDLAAKISLETIIEFLNVNEYPKKVIICCYDIDNLAKYIELIKQNL